MEENVNSTSQVDVSDAPKQSLFSQMFPKLSSFHLNLNVSAILIPFVIIMLVLLIGGGGTYILASNVFKGNTQSKIATTSVSESDIPQFSSISTPTPTVPLPTPTPNDVFPALLTQTPTPTADPSSQWISYAFQPLTLTFKYPPGWYVQVSSGSGPPSFTVQNFSPNSPVPTDTDGVYQIQVSRFEQVGITTITQLTTQLAVNEANNIYINGVNMGIVTVINSGSRTINTYQAYERTITYSNSPFAQVYQLFILDGSGNVVQFMPAYDILYGQTYFNTLVSTVSF